MNEDYKSLIQYYGSGNLYDATKTLMEHAYPQDEILNLTNLISVKKYFFKKSGKAKRNKDTECYILSRYDIYLVTFLYMR